MSIDPSPDSPALARPDVPADQAAHLPHSSFAIGVATFFGGAFAAAYLVYRNFVVLGEPDRAKRGAAWFVAGGALALYVAWHTPPDLISFQLSVGIPQLVAVLCAVRYCQGRAIATYRAAGGKFRSGWFAFAVGVVANVSIKVVFYGLALALQ